MVDDPTDDDLEQSLQAPEAATIPGRAFYRQHLADIRTMTGELHHIASMRKMRLGLNDVLPRTPDSEERDAKLHASLDAVDAEFRKGATFRAEVMSTRYVDSYLAYASEMLAVLLIQEPRAMRSNEQVRIADVLSHKRMDDFIEWLADDRITRLSFKGFSEISQYVDERLGIPLLPSGDLNNRIARSIATRNLIVHRRGVIDRRYVETMRFAGFNTESLVPGRRIAFAALRENAFATLVATMEAVAHFEAASVAKFGLVLAPLDFG